MQYRAIPLAVITMRKSTHDFLLFPIYEMLMGLRLMALRAAGAPLLIVHIMIINGEQQRKLLFKHGGLKPNILI